MGTSVLGNRQEDAVEPAPRAPRYARASRLLARAPRLRLAARAPRNLGAPRNRRGAVLVALLAPLALLLAVLASALVPAPAQASEISKIDLFARLHKDGSMFLTDARTFDATEGSEFFISLGNLGDSKVSQVSVVLDGEGLADVGEWDTHKTRQQKAGTFGIRKTANGEEICFGFGSYGRHRVVIGYNVTNVVKQLTDGSQAVYWEFLPKHMTRTDSVHIEISNEIGFNFRNSGTKIWGFGYKGTTKIEPDKLTATTSGPITSKRHMVVLAVMPGAPFSTPSRLDKSAAELEAQAKEGSDFGSDSGKSDSGDSGQKKSWFARVSDGFFQIVAFVFVGGYAIYLLFGVAVWIWDYWPWRKKIDSPFDAGLTLYVKKPPRDAYWRDIPYDGPIENLVALSGDVVPGLVRAFVLSWIRSGSVRETTRQKGYLFFKHDAPVLEFGDPPAFATADPAAYEGALPYASTDEGAQPRLWNLLVDATQNDQVLERDEIRRYLRWNWAAFTSWKKDVESTSRDAMVSEGYLRRAGSESHPYYEVTPEGKELATRILEFRNYLLDFSLVNERPAADVALWDRYMIWAGYMGISQEVIKQFNIADPNYASRTQLTFSSVVAVNLAGLTMGHSTASSETSDDRTTAALGGGGAASLGGGGGSFGGGSGGGIR